MRSMETAGCTVYLWKGMGFKGRRKLWMRMMGVNRSQEQSEGDTRRVSAAVSRAEESTGDRILSGLVNQAKGKHLVRV